MSRMSVLVERKIVETDDTCSIRLRLSGDAPSFVYEPGQFVHLRQVVEGVEVERSYSVSSTPNIDPFFQLTIKRIVDGKLSPHIVDLLQIGDEVGISEPQGRFFQTPPDVACHFVLIAAGSGVTPLFSMLKHLIVSPVGHSVTMIYASRCETGIIFKNALADLLANNPDRLRVIHVLSRPEGSWSGETGRLDRDRLSALLATHVPTPDKREIAYLCGPPSFMDAAVQALTARGLAGTDIHRESFEVAAPIDAGALNVDNTCRVLPEDIEGADEPPPEACESLTVRIDGEDVAIALEPGETILAGILRVGLDVPFSCQEGTCLSCMCQVQEGAVRMKRHELIGLTPDDLGAGIALACLSLCDSRNVRLSFEDV